MYDDILYCAQQQCEGLAKKLHRYVQARAQLLTRCHWFMSQRDQLLQITGPTSPCLLFYTLSLNTLQTLTVSRSLLQTIYRKQ